MQRRQRRGRCCERAEIGVADVRTDNSTTGLCLLWRLKVGHKSGGHQPPAGWQVTTRQHLECPVRTTPRGSFPAHEPSTTCRARVARKLRAKGHTATAGARCLNAGFMPPPTHCSITSSSLRRLYPLIIHASFAHLPLTPHSPPDKHRIAVPTIAR